MPSASSGVIGRTWATVPSRSTTSASHSTGAPVACAETRSMAPVSSSALSSIALSSIGPRSSPPTMRTSCHVPPDGPAEDATLASWSSPTSSAAAAWSAATTPTGRCRARSSSAVSSNAVRAPSAGFSQGWDFLVLTERRGARGVLERHDRPGCARATPGSAAYGRRRCSCCACRTRTPTSIATRRPTRAGPTATRPGGRCPTGTSTPAWRRCSSCSPRPTRASAASSSACRRSGTTPCTRPSPSPSSRTIIGVVSIGYAVPGPRSPSLRRHRAGPATTWPTGAASAWQVTSS